MNLTTACEIPYPTQYADPWFTQFVSTMSALDAIALAAREDRNVLVRSTGGVVHTSGGAIRWTQAIEFTDPRSGLTHTLAAGTATLTNGQFLYVAFPRGAAVATALSAVVASTAPNADTIVVLAGRRDISSIATITLRTGQQLAPSMSCVPWFLPQPSCLMLVKAAATLVYGSIVEADATGGIIQSATGSTNPFGVSLTPCTGDGATVYAVVQYSGIVAMTVESGQTVTAGVGVKVGGVANQVRSVGGGTFVGRLGIALQTVVGTGVNTCPVLLSPHGT